MGATLGQSIYAMQTAGETTEINEDVAKKDVEDVKDGKDAKDAKDVNDGNDVKDGKDV
jgi:hypothetical protein